MPLHPNQYGKLLTHDGTGAQGLHAGGHVLWSGPLELQEVGYEHANQVDLTGKVTHGEVMESQLFSVGEVTGIEGGDGGRGGGHFI